MTEQALLSWSGGKDSAMSLYVMQEKMGIRAAALLSTICAENSSSFMNNVEEALLEQQAQFTGIAIEKIYVSKDEPNEYYEQKMRTLLSKYMSQGINKVAFGDIFLEELRENRQNKLNQIGAEAIFPLWQKDTRWLAEEFIGLGFKAVVTCIDTNYLNKEFVGRDYDSSFLSELPDCVDKCGENGEFHTFVYSGPIFKQDILFEKGREFEKFEHFYYCDLQPVVTVESESLYNKA